MSFNIITLPKMRGGFVFYHQKRPREISKTASGFRKAANPPPRVRLNEDTTDFADEARPHRMRSLIQLYRTKSAAIPITTGIQF
jgi:hypothetical protein